MNILGIDYGLKNVGFAIGEQITNSCSTYFSKKFKNKKERKNFAANKYVSAWQRKIETIGNLNYPDFVDSSVPLKLTLSVTLGKDGDLLDYALIKAS